MALCLIRYLITDFVDKRICFHCLVWVFQEYRGFHFFKTMQSSNFGDYPPTLMEEYNVSLLPNTQFLV